MKLSASVITTSPNVAFQVKLIFVQKKPVILKFFIFKNKKYFLIFLIYLGL